MAGDLTWGWLTKDWKGKGKKEMLSERVPVVGLRHLCAPLPLVCRPLWEHSLGLTLRLLRGLRDYVATKLL